MNPPRDKGKEVLLRALVEARSTVRSLVQANPDYGARFERRLVPILEASVATAFAACPECAATPDPEAGGGFGAHVMRCVLEAQHEASVERKMDRAHLGRDAPSVPEERY